MSSSSSSSHSRNLQEPTHPRLVSLPTLPRSSRSPPPVLHQGIGSLQGLSALPRKYRVSGDDDDDDDKFYYDAPEGFGGSGQFHLPIKHQLKLLKRHENEMLSILQEINLVDLVNKLVHSSVLVDKVRNDIITLDVSRLDWRVGTRYLIKMVVNSIYTSNATWNKFIAFLSGLGCNAKQLSLKLKEAKAKCELHGDCNCPVCSKASVNHDLQESDIPRLMKVLTPCSYKWEEIGIALGLPRHVIEECRKGGSNINMLHEILCCWIEVCHKKALHTPQETLRDALAGPIVDCSGIATKLVEEFKKEPDDYAYESLPDLSVGSDDGKRIQIIYQSECVEVMYGKSTVIAVVASPSDLMYRWLKNGDAIDDRFHDGMLYIHEVTDNGKYVCCIKNLQAGGASIRSDEVTVNVVYPPKNVNLTNLYAQLPEIPNNPWPPVSTSTFISLALINQGKQRRGPYTYVVNNSVDDILEDKDKIKYQDVFGKFLKGALFFVEGRPGSGKTTLVHKVSRDWATSQRALRGASMVYLVSLRMLNSTEKDKNVFDILRPFFVDKDETRAALATVKKSYGDGVCFILDGLDEYNGNGKQNVIQDLIHKRILPLSMVIVASRPIGISIHRGANVTKEIEVVGFTKENVCDYIKQYPFKSADVASKLILYLAQHDNVQHMCYLPVHSAMVCYLYNILGDSIPHIG